tara:strand:- start:252 stop:1181 length:930 start_codon:yes stop_codon:yes gene_type:complete
MKKPIIILSFVLLILLVGCTQSEETKEKLARTAIFELDETICEEISAVVDYKTMDADFKSDLFKSSVAISGRDYRTECFNVIAVRKLDEKICERIPIGDRDFCVEVLALKKDNISICNMLSGMDKAYCLSTVVRIRLKPDEKVCEQIGEIELTGRYANSEESLIKMLMKIKDNCLMVVGGIKQDIEMCNTIASNDSRIACIAIVKGDVETCKNAKFKYSSDKDECMTIMALVKDDKEICREISSHSTASSCFKESRIQKVKSCENIKPESEKNKCITEIAVIEGDTNLCGQIKDYDSEKECKVTVTSEQ